MKRVFDFLKKAEIYYLATVEGDQPRVRPFGTINEFEGKLYIQTGKVKVAHRPVGICLTEITFVLLGNLLLTVHHLDDIVGNLYVFVVVLPEIAGRP